MLLRCCVIGLLSASVLQAAPKKTPATKPTATKANAAAAEAAEINKNYPLPYPPKLPGEAAMVVDRSDDFLKPMSKLREGVLIANEAPTIVFGYYPGQDHPGKPWSNWGEGCFANGKYYSAIGDHLSPRGSALVTEFDPKTYQLRILADTRKVLEAAGEVSDTSNYAPGKVHSRIRMGADGWLYYATHRGSPKTTTDAYGYRGDWILRTDPQSGKTEIVATAPVPKHAIPMSGLDPKRLIFYGGTAPGSDSIMTDVQFLAYDLKARKPLLTVGDGPKRGAIFANNGKVYWEGKRYDPDTNKLEACPTAPDVRSSTDETADGMVYGTTARSAEVWAFDVKNEKLEQLGNGAVNAQEYITSMVADPSGRFLYYVPGAHGKASSEGTPIVQFDVKTKKPKVIAFLSPFYKQKYNYTPDGTYSVAIDDKGESLFVTWNGFRTGQPRFWESCAITMIRIPESERK